MAKKVGQQETFSASLIAGSDAVFDYICQSCNEDGKLLEAVGFCVDCLEFLCDECFRCHLKPRISRHHKLLDIEAAKKDPNLSAFLDTCTQKCAHHKGKTIEYFCVDHDCLGCGDCLNIDHNNCQGVQFIPKIAKDIGNGVEFSTLIRELDMLLLQTKELSDTSLGNKLKSQDIFDKALGHVKKVKNEVNEAFNKLEKEIETLGKTTKKKDLLKMEENIKSCDNIQTKAQNLSIDMKAMQNDEQYCNLFVTMKTTKTEMRSLVKSLEDISKDNTISNYLFQPSEQLDNFLKHGGSLGKLFMKEEIITKATKVGEIKVTNERFSNTCDITGMVLITSGRMAVADNKNRKVKLIDIQNSQVISECQLPWPPWDITTIEESGDIAVTRPKNSDIVLLRTRYDRFYEHKKIKTTGPCYGIVSVNNNFVASLSNPERLEIIDTEGNVLQTVEKDENGKRLFSDVYSIAVNQNTSTLYVPDASKGTVTRLSLSGQVLGIYEDSNLKGARYVAVDKRGSVYVCCGASGTIYQITADCKKISILTKKDGLGNAKSLCYDTNTDYLYVGQENNTVSVYQLL